MSSFRSSQISDRKEATETLLNRQAQKLDDIKEYYNDGLTEMTFCIGQMSFTTKRKARDFVMSYLREAKPGQIQKADQEWVEALLMMHPRYVAKSTEKEK